MKTYCYVSNENCVSRQVKPLGEGYYRKGDYSAWTLGKKDTLAIASASSSAYQRATARAVLRFMGWARDQK